MAGADAPYLQAGRALTPSGRRPRSPAEAAPGAAGGSPCACLPPVRPYSLSFELFAEGDPLYAAMEEAIGRAQHEVGLESFIFAGDEVGRRLADRLAQRARRGVRVRLLVDAAGSFGRLPGKLVRGLRAAGVEFAWYHRWSWRRPFRYVRRDHRKLLVVDRREAFLGGFNVHRENSRRWHGPARWRDTHVRVRGELAAQAAVWFERSWARTGPAEPGDLPDDPARLPGALLVATPSARCRRRLVCLYAALLRGARIRVSVTTPYFGPDPELWEALRAAGRRGVDARLLVPRRADPRLAGWVTRAHYGVLLESGVRVFEFASRRLHAKTLEIDGEWGSVGSVNLDQLSLFLNQELLLLARSRELAGALAERFAEDLRESQEVRPAAWRQRGAAARLAEAAGWGLRRLL